MGQKEIINNQVNVLFCGLIRQDDLFKKSISDLVNFRKEKVIDNIFLSTWDYEIDTHEGMRDFLRQNKIILIESKEPEDKGNWGNIWCQMKSLEEGLKKIPKNSFVLKTRADLYLNGDFLKKLFTKKETLLKITKPLPKGNIFKYKVWVPWFELTRPFFMADECFFGYHSDLALLYNYNKFYEEKCNIGPDIHHIMRFIDPFLKDYPILESSIKQFGQERPFKNFLHKKYRKFYEKLQEFKFLREISETSRFNLLKKRLENEDFVECLVAYYSILYSHFYFDSMSFPNQIIFRGYYGNILDTLNYSRLEDNFSKKAVSVKYTGRIYSYNQKFLETLFSKKFEKTPLAEKFYTKIDAFSSSS